MPDAIDYHDDYEDEEEEIEAYCVSCKEKTMMENPQPVWTKRGAPGTRGHCDMCGTTVFRMGRTEAHQRIKQPKVPKLQTADGTSVTTDWQGSTYINYARADKEVADRLAHDLSRIGMPVWVNPEPNGGDEVNWAGGVHPALEDCKNMIVVLSNQALGSESVEEAWTYFRQHNKSVVVAMVERCDIPDGLRRRPRFDFREEDAYKLSFREMIEALSTR